MELCRSTVRRKLVLFESDEHGVRQLRRAYALIALARCATCRRRLRVLPCDVLPHKHYALAVIEHELAAYARGNRSLRQVTWSVLGEPTPAHTTLHAWTEGLGAHVLGRVIGGAPGTEPFSRLLAQTVARIPATEARARAQVHVDPRRYRSPARHERLAAVGMMLAVVALVTALRAPDSISDWRRLALVWSLSCTLAFRTGFACTGIGQVDRDMRPRSRSACQTHPDPCPTRARSPPGVSS